MKRYELIEHPADTGIRCRAPSFPALLEDLAWGLFDLATDRAALEGEEACESMDIAVEGASAEETVFAWLRELLYLFAARGFIPLRFEFRRAEETAAAAVMRGIRFDHVRHVQKSEVKAVTRHCFRAGREADTWTAEVIFDL